MCSHLAEDDTGLHTQVTFLPGTLRPSASCASLENAVANSAVSSPRFLRRHCIYRQGISRRVDVSHRSVGAIFTCRLYESMNPVRCFRVYLITVLVSSNSRTCCISVRKAPARRAIHPLLSRSPNIERRRVYILPQGSWTADGQKTPLHSCLQSPRVVKQLRTSIEWRRRPVSQGNQQRTELREK